MIIKCSSCGKNITLDDIKKGNAIVVTTEFGYEIYCYNEKCLDEGHIVKVK